MSVMETERLILRELRIEDKDDLAKVFSDPESMQYYDHPFSKEEVENWIDDENSDMLQFDNMFDRAITGTNNWNHYGVVLDVGEAADSIHFGVLLIGQGKVWVDQFSI
ncbi:N-acetyltransferase [Macrococcus brunensis]|uniref:N-acetyltransferase n=1 Tax=Macrococcus brunensis TaxID=198483 RepID=A0A4R6BBF3_9STAP|nr:GNAT family N-acetyltransferase [Macrococcus brunensis]TDL94304.1 N-acetyltransferase [Macrococcus brunensis]